jgi:hypothetical protein
VSVTGRRASLRDVDRAEADRKLRELADKDTRVLKAEIAAALRADGLTQAEIDAELAVIEGTIGF